jgi:hypothetical protein
MNWGGSPSTSNQVTADSKLLVTDQRAWPDSGTLLVGDTRVWVGPFGASGNCVNFFSTSGTGQVVPADEPFSAVQSIACDQLARLYCVQK